MGEHAAEWLVVGGGAMARAILTRAASTGEVRPERTLVVEPDGSRREGFASMGYQVAAGLRGATGRWAPGGCVLLAIKPQVLPEVVADLRALIGGGAPLVVSILAGATTSAVEAASGPGARVVRVMPNLPATLGLGVSAVCAGATARAEDVRRVKALFAAVGPCVVELPEALMDAFTATAGSGPAYVFYLAEAMEAGAREVGIDPAMAREVVAATLRGAAAMLDGAVDPAALRANVTSRGGTTAAAIAELDDSGVLQAWLRAIVAARNRGRELGGGAGSGAG
jgi:pyrroline-5-carboxylate reductase